MTKRDESGEVGGSSSAVLARRASELLVSALRKHGVERGGVRAVPVDAPAGGARRVLEIDGAEVVLVHDEREAPMALDARGAADDALLVSLTDEGGVKVCAWAWVPPASTVQGIGIDLAATEHFEGERGEMFNHLLFTARELRLVKEGWPFDPGLGYAYAFSAKEAAFKACAAPLRAWYAAHDEELAFDVRSFELVDGRHERGTARRGEAQRALDAMGITDLELHRMAYVDLRGSRMALTIALALG